MKVSATSEGLVARKSAKGRKAKARAEAAQIEATAKAVAELEAWKIEAAKIAAAKREAAKPVVGEATEVRNQIVDRGPKNWPGFFIAITDAYGNALSKVYRVCGEERAKALSLAMAISHRLPQNRGPILSAPAA